jgi:hypothetical protein
MFELNISGSQTQGLKLQESGNFKLLHQVFIQFLFFPEKLQTINLRTYNRVYYMLEFIACHFFAAGG